MARISLPSLGDSVFVAGNPKSGKTVLSKYLFTKWIPYFRNGLVLMVDIDIDAKDWSRYCDITLPPNLLPHEYLKALREHKSVCVDGHRLSFDELKGVWNMLLDVCLARGKTLVVCDEIARVSSSNQLTPNHFLMVSGRGRKRGCSIIQATQRLQRCAMDIRTQADHKFIFRLDLQDVKKYLSFMPDAGLILTLKPYHCLYTHHGSAGKTLTEVLPPCPFKE